jgi:DNA adenine methylase
MHKTPSNIWDDRVSKNLPVKRSPIVYAGGKSKFLDQITKFIPSNIETLVSPFLGGGSLEIAVASNNVRVYGYDLYDHVAIFWNGVLTNPEFMADYVLQFYPMTREKYHELKDITEFENDLVHAADYFAINRASFSGASYSGGYGTNGKNFSLNSIQRLREFKCPMLSVEMLDFHSTFKKHPDDFMYLDPPYMIKSKNLYGKNGSLHKHFDHVGLYELLKDRPKWVMSYDNNPAVKELYKDFRIYELDYNKKLVEVSKTSTEILVVSNDLEVVEC